jgi:hypothetical protein
MPCCAAPRRAARASSALLELAFVLSVFGKGCPRPVAHSPSRVRDGVTNFIQLVAEIMTDIARESLDDWISTLMQCKPLTEAQVKQLCDKVRRRRLCCDRGAAHRLLMEFLSTAWRACLRRTTAGCRRVRRRTVACAGCLLLVAVAVCASRRCLPAHATGRGCACRAIVYCCCGRPRWRVW